MARWVFLAFGAAFFWGTTPIAVKLMGGEIHPFAVAFYRNLFALPIFLAFLYATGRGPATRKSLSKGLIHKMALLGAIGVFAFTALFFLGIDLTLANRASLFVSANPILIAALSVVLLREKIGLKKALGIALGFVGILVVFFPTQNPMDIIASQYLAGDLLTLAAGLSWAIFTIVGKRWQVGLDPYAATFAFSIFGTILLAALTAPVGILLPELSLRSLILIIYLAVFTVFVSYSLWMAALKVAHASSVGVMQFATPVTAAILSVVILDEPAGIPLLVGLVLIGLGIFLALRA